MSAGPSRELVDEARWSDAWFARAHASDDADQRTGLDLAASLPDRDAERRTACIVAFRTQMDLGRADHQALLDRAVVQLAARDVHAAGFLEWAAAASGDLRTRRLAMLRLGIVRGERAELDEALTQFARLYEEIRGTGTELEARTLVNIGVVCRRQNRDVEALAALRRAQEALSELDSVRGQAHVTLLTVGLLEELGEFESIDRLLADAQTLVDTGAGPAPARELIAARVRRALRQGQFEDALQESDALESVSAEPGMGANAAVASRLLRADVLNRAGRVDEARSLLPDTDEEIGAWPSIVVYARRLRVELAAAEGDIEGVRDATVALLACLRAPVSVELGWGRIRDEALRGYRAARASGDLASVRACLDLAATATITRMREIHRLEDEAPVYARLSDADRDLLTRARHRFVEEHGDLAATVAELIDHSPGAAAAWARAALRDADGLSVICAWCRQVWTTQGTWLPLGQYLAGASNACVTHGICPPCEANFIR